MSTDDGLGAARAQARSVTVEAVVVRADGTREDLGAVAYWHRNPLRRLAWRLSRAVRRPTSRR